MHQQILKETGRSEPVVANAFVDYALKEETGFSGFLGYILYINKQGVTIGKAFRSGINLGPFFTWSFWGLELALIGFVTIGMGRLAVGRKFRETCNRWYGKEQHVGGVSKTLAARLTQLLEHRDFVGAGKLLETDAEVPSLEIYAQSCENCNNSGTILELKQVSLGQNGRMIFKPASHLLIHPQEKSDLLRELSLGVE